MKLNFVKKDGTAFSVETDEGTNVQDLKSDVANKLECESRKIELLVSGRPLSNGSVGINGLRDGHTVHILEGVAKINISLDLPNGSPQSLETHSDDTIISVKNKIHEQFGYAVDEIELSFEGKTISDGRLSYHQITNGSTISVKLIEIPITVADMDGKKSELRLPSRLTIDGFKQQLHRETGIIPGQQRLLFQGQQLSSGTLQSNGVRRGSQIYIAGGLRGG